jgi:hypothetical protein
MVARLALVEMGDQPEDLATSPITWEAWLMEGCKGQGVESHDTGALPTPPQGE